MKKRKHTSKMSTLSRLRLIVMAVFVLGAIVFVAVRGASFITQRGTIELRLRDAGTSVILDTHRAGTTQTNDETLTLRHISPGRHRIIVSEYEHWPWAKFVNVQPNATVRLEPVLLQKTPETRVILPYATSSSATRTPNPEYFRIRAAIEEAPTVSVSSDGTAGLSYDASQIYITRLATSTSAKRACIGKSCPDTRGILSEGGRPIKHAEFYPGSAKYVIFTGGDTIFLIETDATGTQNVQPLYTGTDPLFTVEGGIVHVLDGDTVTDISLK